MRRTQACSGSVRYFSKIRYSILVEKLKVREVRSSVTYAEVWPMLGLILAEQCSKFGLLGDVFFGSTKFDFFLDEFGRRFEILPFQVRGSVILSSFHHYIHMESPKKAQHCTTTYF